VNLSYFLQIPLQNDWRGRMDQLVVNKKQR